MLPKVLLARYIPIWDAAMRVKMGECDYYVGACQSGAGGALAMAYAILGSNACITIGTIGIAPKEEKVVEGFSGIASVWLYR